MKKRTEVSLDEFFEGSESISDQTKRKKSRFIVGPLALVLCSTLAVMLAVALPIAATTTATMMMAAPAADVWKRIPSELPSLAIAERNTIYDKNGEVIAQTWSENRVQVQDVKSIGDNAVRALIDTEDRTFYSNSGFNPKGTIRAAVKREGGGSGITQQLIKNLLFYNLLGKDKKQEAIESSYARKIRELKMAMEYERTHTKDEILVDYFNTVAFGAPTVYGIENASQYFFNKKASKLTLAEASVLVGSAQNPVIFNLDDPKAKDSWKGRQKDVLNSMVAAGDITRAESDEAFNTKLKFVKKKAKGGSCYTSKYPFYCKYTMDYLSKSKRLGSTQAERDAIIAKGGLHIKTHMDSRSMEIIENYMETNWGNKNRIIAPTVIVDPKTGGVVAMGVNRDIGQGKGKTDIVLPTSVSGEGSVYKLFTLAAALTQGGMTESELKFSSQCPLRPGPNYDAPPNGFKNSNSCSFQGGMMDYKKATAYSSNTWYVTLEMMIGVDKVKEFSKSVGLEAPDSITNRSLSYTLGSVENSPLQIAAAFATFSNGGVYCPPTPIESMTYGDGTEPVVPDDYDPSKTACKRVMSPKAASVVLKAMRANVSGEVKGAFGLRSNIKGRDNGGKSGTNENLNSAWAHLTGSHSLFTNVYDMEQTNRGIDGAIFKGYARSSHENTAQTTGGEIMAAVTKGTPKTKMPFNETSTEITPIPVDKTDFFTVPSVIGMSPDEAVQTLNSAGVNAKVSKTQVEPPKSFPGGVVTKQSIAPGEKLAKGTKQEIVLTISRER